MFYCGFVVEQQYMIFGVVQFGCCYCLEFVGDVDVGGCSFFEVGVFYEVYGGVDDGFGGEVVGWI